MRWTADLGDGRYRNPILYADYSDPDVIRVGDDYYMTASSFCNVPGLPVLHSRDLVHWTLINHALKKIPEFRYRDPMHGCGVWAPAIRHHAGVYYICFPMPDEGIYMVTAHDPAGEWSEPVKLHDGAGYIDPCPFWDEDGRAYLVYGVAKSRIGYKSVLWMQEMRPDGMALLGERVRIYDGTADGNVTTEGPKLYKRNGWYYVFAPAGGVKTGWQIVLRSRQIYGPYEVRTVMRQGSTGVNGPHQGAWVDAVAQDGSVSDWFLHFQDVFAAGRIVHLQPMRWGEDGWPVIGRPMAAEAQIGEPVTEWELPRCRGAVAGASGEDGAGIAADAGAAGAGVGMAADAGTAGVGIATAAGTRASAGREVGAAASSAGIPAWQWNANPQEAWTASEQDAQAVRVRTLWIDGVAEAAGSIPPLAAVKVSAERPLCDVPSLLLRRWEAPAFTVEAELDLSGLADGGMAGLMSMGIVYAGIAIAREGGRYFLRCVRGQQTFDGGMAYARQQQESAELAIADVSRVRFRMEVRPTNEVSATSPKPEYTEGEEAKVLHPEAVIRLLLVSAGAAKDAAVNSLEDGAVISSKDAAASSAEAGAVKIPENAAVHSLVDGACISSKDAAVNSSEGAIGNAMAAVEIPAVAGRWVGVKYGFFHIKI